MGREGLSKEAPSKASVRTSVKKDEGQCKPMGEEWEQSMGGKNELGIRRNIRSSNSGQEHQTRRGRARSGETARNLNLYLYMIENH